MRQVREGLARHWFVVTAIAIIVAFGLVFFAFPPLYITRTELPNTADRLRAQNDVRGTALQALAGIVAIVAAYVAYRSWREDRFSKLEERLRELLKQLESDHAEVRLASIEGLGRLANESKTHAQLVAKVLTVWIRRRFNAERPHDEDGTGDLAEALGVLSTLRLLLPTPLELRLAGADLRGVDLRAAQLGGADLTGANLDSIDLATADLARARLARATLRGTILLSADLSRADLFQASLDGANLDGAVLAAARLEEAALIGVVLRRADLRNALLRHCNLERARCEGASFAGADCRLTSFRGAGLSGADLTGALLAGSDFAGAEFDRFTSWPEGFDPLASGAILYGE